MKFCPVVPEICRGHVHVTKKERRIIIIITIIIRNGAKTISLQATLGHTCQVTRFRRVTPGNRACHPHFPEHSSGHGFHYDDPESPGIGPDIRNIYLFGKYRDFTYRKDNNPNGQLQSTIYLRGK